MRYIKIIVALIMTASAIASCDQSRISLTVENTAMVNKAVSSLQPIG